MFFADEDTADNADDQTAGDSADADQTDSDDSATDGSADDTGAADDTGDDVHDKKEGDDKKADPMIPKSRFDEVIAERNSARDETTKLQGQVEYLADIVAKTRSGDKVSEKQQDKAQNALDALIEAGEVKKEDAIRLQKILDAAGYKRGDDKPDSRVEKLEKTVEGLTKLLGDKEDRAERETVLKKYGDIITEDDLDTVMKQWAKSRDPEERQAAQSWGYEKIVKIAFHDKIVASEVDKALKGKKKPAPAIGKKGGDKSPKKPDQSDFEWKSGDGESSTEALKRSIIADMADDAE